MRQAEAMQEVPLLPVTISPKRCPPTSQTFLRNQQSHPSSGPHQNRQRDWAVVVIPQCHSGRHRRHPGAHEGLQQRTSRGLWPTPKC